jgi:hypothetical protein
VSNPPYYTHNIVISYQHLKDLLANKSLRS